MMQKSSLLLRKAPFRAPATRNHSSNTASFFRRAKFSSGRWHRLLLIGLLLAIAMMAAPVAAATITVAADGSGDFTTLSSAVAAAASGDTVYVKAGTYTESSDISVTLPDIAIMGEDPDMVYIDMGGNSINLQGSNDHLENLSITSLNQILTTGSGCLIRNNILQHPVKGILIFSANNLVTLNWVLNPSLPPDSGDVSGTGIIIGVVDDTSSSVAFINNTIRGNVITGANGGWKTAGVVIASGSNVFENNIISGSDYCGLILTGPENILVNNLFMNNAEIGIIEWPNYDVGNENNIFYLNTFRGNGDSTSGWYTSVEGFWPASTISNSIVPLTYTYNGATYSHIVGNFWDTDYTGTDTDGNGIADTGFALWEESSPDNAPLMGVWQDGTIYNGPDAVAPRGGFTVSTITGEEPLTVQFTSWSEGPGTITSYAWDFNNDGMVDSTDKNPGYTYSKYGTYTVSLTITGPGGSDTITKADYIHVNAPAGMPVADFEADPTTGAAPLIVAFTDKSTGATSWSWDFDNDGTIDSTVQNPTHTYTVPGNYTVNLTASNSAGSNSIVKADYISVPKAPVTGFNATPASGDPPLTVSFSDNSTGATSWSWDFDNDGMIDSTVQNPTHTFLRSGTYTVNLTVTGPGGTTSYENPGCIVVNSILPVANFTVDKTSGEIPLTIRFSDTSIGSVTAWSWDFQNDGIIDSTLENPAYTYNAAGNYTVNLTVSGSEGTNSAVKTDLVTVKLGTDLSISSVATLYPGFNAVTATIANTGTAATGAFKADLTIDGNTTTLDVAPIAGGDTTTISATDAVWRKYGDSVPVAVALDTTNAVAESNETNNGYSATLTVAARDSWLGGRYAYGTDLETTYSAEGNLGVAISNGGTGYYGGNPTYTASELGIPADATIKTARMYLAWTWYGYTPYTVSFNGHSIAAPIAHYPDGNDGQDVYDVTGYFVPGADNTASISGGGTSYGRTLIVVYENASQPYRHVYLNEGYDIIYRSEGYAMFRNISTDDMGSAQVITVTPSGAGDTGAIGFNGKSVTLGSGGGSDPNFNYYDVTSTLQSGTNELRADRASYYALSTAILTVTQASVPIAAFTADTTTGMTPLTVTFTDASTNSPTSWLWDFGDSDSTNATVQNPVHTYAGEGTYAVTLTATNSLGSDSETKAGYITVTAAIPVPVAAFSATQTSGTFPLTVQFTDASTNTPTSWAWDFNSDGTIDSTEQNPSHTYTSAGTFTVNLTATNEYGSDSETKTGFITVNTVTEPSLPLTTEQTGTVSGDLYFSSYQPVPFADQPTSATVRDFDQSFNLPAFTDVQWAKVYVNVYSGSGSANWPALTTISLDGNGDGTYENILGVENMDTESYSADGTVFWLNNHMNRVYSDYETEYDVTSLITSTTPAVHVKVEKTGANFDGRLKAVTLVVAYNDGDSDQVKYWVNHGHDWINSGLSSTTFATSGLASGFTAATLNNVGLSSYDAAYTFNGVSQAGADPVAPIKYYESHTWPVTDAVIAGSDSTFNYALTSGSFKTTLATLAVKYPSSIPSIPVAAFSAAPISGAAPLTVRFTDASTNTPTSWAWDFGDGSSTNATDQNPVHTFASAGSYTVKLMTANAAGSGDVTKYNYITASAATHTWYVDASGAGDYTDIQSAVNAASAGDTIIIRAGTYTPSSSIFVDKQLRIYGEGTDKVTVTVGGDGDIVIGQDADGNSVDASGTHLEGLTINGKQVLAATGSDSCIIRDNVLENTIVVIRSANNLVTNNRVLNATAGGWGGGVIQIGDWENALDETVNYNNNIVSNNIISGTTGSYGVTISSAYNRFENNTISGSLYACLHLYGASNTILKNRFVDYSDIGVFVDNDGNSNIENNRLYLNNFIGNGVPVTSWGSPPPSTIYLDSPDPETYTYHGMVYEEIVGNYYGNAYTGPDADGNGIGDTVFTMYNANSDWFGSDTAPLMGQWMNGVISGGTVSAPVAVFTADKTSGTAPLSVVFTDASTNSPTSWAWDFNNDGTIDSTRQNPSYTFTTAGTYTINLTVTNAGGSNSETKTGYISVIAANPLAETAWPKFQADAGNTGQSPYNGPQTNNAVWNYTTGKYVYSAPAIGTDGTIFVGGADKNLYALSPDGTLRWTYATGSMISGAPAIETDGTVLIGSRDNNLYALRPDGSLKWSHATGSQVWGSPAIGTDGTIFIGSRDKNLYALNSDGSLRWSYTTTGEIRGSPAIGIDGTLYIGSNDYKIYAVNSDGTLKWSYTTGSGIAGSPAVGAGGTIYAGSTDNKLYALNSDGTLRWSYTTGNKIMGSPAIGSDGTIYTGSDDNNLYAINPDGTLKWTYTTGSKISGSPAIGTDGTLYIGSNDAKIYALSSDGTLKWSYTTGSGIAGSPAIGADGTLYIGSNDYKIYAFRDVPLPVAAFTATPTSGTIPLTVQFTDTSTGSPETWAWDFDNDGTVDSTNQNPSYTFTTAGTYTVNLTVTNAGGSNSEVKTAYITVSDSAAASMTVTKSASVSTLLDTGGEVIYTYLVMNTGSPAISSVTLTDDKLGAVTGPASGDTNRNGVLDTGETWTYTAAATLTETTTNTATVTGSDPAGAPVTAMSNSVTVSVGATAVPEFPTVAFPVMVISALAYLVMTYRKVDEESP